MEVDEPTEETRFGPVAEQTFKHIGPLTRDDHATQNGRQSLDEITSLGLYPERNFPHQKAALMAKRRDVSSFPATKTANLSAPIPARKSRARKIAEPVPAVAPDLALAIIYVSPSGLIDYGNNPRTHSPSQIQQIAESIKTFGFVSPLIVDSVGQLIAGHGRLAAAKLLGLER